MAPRVELHEIHLTPHLSPDTAPPAQLDPLVNAKGRPLFLLHSPTDKQCHIEEAEAGRDAAKKAGLDVEWATYEGGHGWAGESETIARRAIRWLADHAK